MIIRRNMDSSSVQCENLVSLADFLFCNRTNDVGSSSSSHVRISRQSIIVNASIISSSNSTISFPQLSPMTNVTKDDGDYYSTSNEILLDFDERTNRLAYSYGILPLIFFCVVSVAINIKILMTVHWIKRPISPTLHISLSLAGADAFSSAALAVGLAMNSFIPHGLGLELSGLECYLLGLEAVRLGGVVTTMGHLVALAINHYLGILRPLHYLSIMTHRITMFLTILIWTLPILFFLAYFSLIDGEGFQSQQCATNTFLLKKKFRIMFSSLFFGPFVLMVVIYGHIFRIVKKHQASRLRFSQAGSSFRRNESTSGNMDQRASQQIARNIKAIHTTLFIIGSVVIGWMPAIILYVFVCDDCLLKFDWITGDEKFVVYNASNCLVILKTMVNPIIYAARMHEIQVATRRMHNSLCGFCDTLDYSSGRNPMCQSTDGFTRTNRSSFVSTSAGCKVTNVGNVDRKRSRDQNTKYTYNGIKGYSCGSTSV